MEFPRSMYTLVGVIKLSEFSLFMGSLFVSENVSHEPQNLLLIFDLICIPVISVILVVVRKYDWLRHYLVGLQVLHIVLSVLWLLSAIGVFVCFFLTSIYFYDYELALFGIFVAEVILVTIETLIFIRIVYKRLTFKADSIPKLMDIDLTHPIELVSVSKLAISTSAIAQPTRRRLKTPSDLSLLILKDEFHRPYRTSATTQSGIFRDQHRAFIDVAPSTAQRPPAIEIVQPTEICFAVTASHIHKLCKTSNSLVDNTLSTALDIVSKMK